MRLVSVVLLLTAFLSSVSAITVKDVARLTEVKSSDELILRLIYHNPPADPLSTDDVIYLKKNGVSETVISYLLSGASSRPSDLPHQVGDSHKVSKGSRYYYTANQDGEKHLVLTNLDENGKRMGPPPPPAPPERTYRSGSAQHIENPQRVYVIVRHEEPEPERHESRYRSNYSRRRWNYPHESSFGFHPYLHFPYESSFRFHPFPQFFVIHPKLFHHRRFRK